jgi:integrase/recombinase XerC
LHNIDFSNQQIKVVGKRNKERLIPLLPSMLLQLKEYQVERNALLSIIDSEYFFLTSKGNKMYDGLVYRIINTYLSTVTQKKKKSPHMLRHTFATHLLNNGADLSSVKELLGHASLASTQVYTHTSLSELKNTHLKAHPRNKK